MGLFQRSSRTYSLGAAARQALETARREKLALAHVAEQDGAPEFWFALNILGVAAVEGRRAGASEAERLDRESFGGLVLDADMARLCAPGGAEEDITELSVSAREFAKYLSWARSVQ